MSRKTQPFSVYPSEDVVSRDRPVKRDKIPCCKKTRDTSNTRSPPERDKFSTLFAKKVRTTKARSTSSGQQTVGQLHREPSYSYFNKGREEPWSQLLKNSTKEQSTFSHFDPLRTLHFLIKELECRIRNDIPDFHLQQIVHDMLSALNRVPPEVASTIHLHQNLETEDQLIENSKRYLNIKHETRPDKEIKTYKTLVNKGVQTPRALYTDETELFRKEVEASTMKLEESCKQMETFCEKMKTEKQELEQKYKLEKESVKVLKKRCQELEEQKHQSEQTIDQLTRERDALKAAKYQETPSHVKTIIKELTAQKLEAEKDCVTLRHQLAISDLEKEKYITLLAVRERQCKEIRDETQQLQDVIKRQLLELSGTNTDTHQENDGYTLSAVQSYLPEPQQNKHGLFAELQSGDSSAVDLENKKLDSSDHVPSRDILMKTSEGMLMADISHSNNIPETLKQVFEELKREAYSITANLYDRS